MVAPSEQHVSIIYTSEKIGQEFNLQNIRLHKPAKPICGMTCGGGRCQSQKIVLKSTGFLTKHREKL